MERERDEERILSRFHFECGAMSAGPGEHKLVLMTLKLRP